MTQHPTTHSDTRKAAHPTSGEMHELDNLYISETESLEKHGSEEDDEWVDYEDYDEEEDPRKRLNRRVNARSSGTLGDGSVGVRSTTRKRRKGAPLARKDITPSSSTKPSRSAAFQGPPQYREAVVNGLWKGAEFAFDYATHLVINAFHHLRQPLSILLSICLMISILTFVAGYISQSLYRAFQPACIIPGISSLSICRPLKPSSIAPSGNMTPKWADFATLMNVQSKSFEQLLEESAGGSGLSLEIKKAEMATSDLVARVRVSELNARDSLARSLSVFIDDAKKTGRGLQKLTSKVGGAVDNIMAVNDYALQAIENARAKESSRWSLNRIISREGARKQVDEVVTRTFAEAMNVLSVNMERLIVEAEYNLHNLNELEERLITLHEIVAREDSYILSAKSDLLEDLWTRLGGNRKSLRNFDYHLGLLKGLGTYRQQALAHVVAALQTLRAMSEDMEDMRERVATPDLIGATVPVEVHMKSIQMGLDRLHEGRIRAKKLEQDAVRRVLSVDDESGDD